MSSCALGKHKTKIHVLLAIRLSGIIPQDLASFAGYIPHSFRGGGDVAWDRGYGRPDSENLDLKQEQTNLAAAAAVPSP